MANEVPLDQKGDARADKQPEPESERDASTRPPRETERIFRNNHAAKERMALTLEACGLSREDAAGILKLVFPASSEDHEGK